MAARGRGLRRYTDANPLSASRYVFPVVLALLPPRGRVLDVGCGNGALVSELLARGYEAAGVDTSEDGIRIASSSYPDARFEQMAADEIRALGTTFDVVVATEVIEHLYDPEAFLTAARDCLVPGGQVIVSTPYHGYVKNLMLAVAGKWDSHHHPSLVGGHIKFFSPATLRDTLRAAGFQDLEVRGAGRVRGLWKSMVMTGRRAITARR